MDIRTRGKFTASCWLALAVAGLTLAFGVDGAQAAFPGANGRIAFAVEKWRLPVQCPRDVPHGCEPEVISSRIDTVLPSGRGRRALRAFPAGQGAGPPVWSPSGRLLTFQQGSRLAIIRRDGTGLRRLPQLTSGDGAPTWSPDGRRLAFTGSSVCCNWLYTVRTDGTALRRVIAREALVPAWSATGTIAFVNNTGQGRTYSGLKAGLYTIRPDGSRLRAAVWSLGQARLVARREQDRLQPPQPDLHRQGRRPGLRRLTAQTRERIRSSGPSWSPDGRYIAFIRAGDLYVMRANGRGLRRVVDAPQQDLDHPDRAWAELSTQTWQPLPR